MSKYIVILLLFSSMLCAKYYDNTIITIEAKLFPKIALLEQSIKDSNSTTLKITIVADDDFYEAKIFKKNILSNYPNPIRNKKIIVDISNFNTIKMKSTDAIIVLTHQPEKLKKIALWANQNKIVSFVYDSSNIKYGFLASIYIGKSTKPYLNKQTIIDYNFIFDAYFLQLSKINSN